MLSFGILFLVMSAIDALVLTPESNLSPNIAESSAGDNASLQMISSTLLHSPSFITTTSSLSVANSSLASNNSSSALVMVACAGTLGYNLNFESCISALRTIQHDSTRQSTWGPYGTGVEYDFPVPRRWVSSDGTCIIQMVLTPGSASAIASLEDVARGAGGVILQCIQKRKVSEGGVAKAFGGDNKLGLLVAKTSEAATKVRCYGNAATMNIVSSCESLMDKMNVSTATRVFGRSGVGVDVELPYTWHSDDHRCVMTLRSSGPMDSSSWGRVWEAATITTAMCTRQGKKGLHSQIGANRKLYLEVAAEGVGDEETW